MPWNKFHGPPLSEDKTNLDKGAVPVRKAFLLGAVSILSACGGGGGSGGDGGSSNPSIAANTVCNLVGAGSYVNSVAAPPSVFTNPTQAFDGNLSTYATLGPVTNANGTISGGGISGSAGEIAGVAFARPNSGSVSVTITTYLSGVVSNSATVGTVQFTPTGEVSGCTGHCDLNRPYVFFGIDTNLDFDKVEAEISISNIDAPLQIAELCLK